MWWNHIKTVCGAATENVKLFICAILNDASWGSFVHLENCTFFLAHYKLQCVCVWVCAFRRPVNPCKKCVAVKVLKFLFLSLWEQELKKDSVTIALWLLLSFKKLTQILHQSLPQSLPRIPSLFISEFITNFTLFSLKHFFTFTSDFYLIFYLHSSQIWPQFISGYISDFPCLLHILPFGLT